MQKKCSGMDDVKTKTPERVHTGGTASSRLSYRALGSTVQAIRAYWPSHCDFCEASIDKSTYLGGKGVTAASLARVLAGYICRYQ